MKNRRLVKARKKVYNDFMNIVFDFDLPDKQTLKKYANRILSGENVTFFWGSTKIFSVFPSVENGKNVIIGKFHADRPIKITING